MTSNQQWDAALYDSRHQYVSRYGEDMLDMLNPQPGQRVLDLGCGTGHLAAKIAASGAQVVGLDSSAEMITTARAAYPALTFVQGDAADFRFDQPFDAVFSNAALHWVTAAEAAAACVFAALKPGGRFVAEFGGQNNIRAVLRGLREAMHAEGSPWPEKPHWYFPSLGDYASLLERAGFRVTFALHFDRPTASTGEDGLRSWLAMFAGGILAAVPAQQQEAVLARAENLLRPTLYRDGAWYIDYRRLRVMAVRET